MKKGFISDIKFALDHISYGEEKEKEIKKSFNELKKIIKVANAFKNEGYVIKDSKTICLSLRPGSKNHKVLYEFLTNKVLKETEKPLSKSIDLKPFEKGTPSTSPDDYIWIYYQTPYSKGRMIINCNSINKLKTHRAKRLYKLISDQNQVLIIPHHNNVKQIMKFKEDLERVAKIQPSTRR